MSIFKSKVAVSLGAAASALALAISVTTLAPGSATAAQSQPPYGVLDAAQSSTPVSGITTETTLTALSTTFNVDDSPNFTSRYVKFTAVVRLASTANATTGDVYIDVMDNFLSPPQTYRIAGSSIYLPLAGGAGGETVVVHGFAFLRHSSFTADVRVKRTAGSGSLMAAMPGGTVMSLLVEDIGDVF